MVGADRIAHVETEVALSLDQLRGRQGTVAAQRGGNGEISVLWVLRARAPVVNAFEARRPSSALEHRGTNGGVGRVVDGHLSQEAEVVGAVIKSGNDQSAVRDLGLIVGGQREHSIEKVEGDKEALKES